jgi:hypothetical protein
MHPRSPGDPGIYFYWTCQSTVPPDADPFVPEQAACPDSASTLPDSEILSGVPLMGNRVDRFTWNAATLRADRNLVTWLAFQHDGHAQIRKDAQMQLHTYLNYDGNCEQAFRFYEQHLDGEITMLMRHREQPSPGAVSPDWKDAVLHARVLRRGNR